MHELAEWKFQGKILQQQDLRQHQTRCRTTEKKENPDINMTILLVNTWPGQSKITTKFEKDDISVSDTGGSEEKIQAVFNIEIGQSGSYVPNGILNWVISKMEYVKLWYWNFEQL